MLLEAAGSSISLKKGHSIPTPAFAEVKVPSPLVARENEIYFDRFFIDRYFAVSQLLMTHSTQERHYSLVYCYLFHQSKNVADITRKLQLTLDALINKFIF
jgi:hypothetical protein